MICPYKIWQTQCGELCDKKKKIEATLFKNHYGQEEERPEFIIIVCMFCRYNIQDKFLQRKNNENNC